MQLSLHTKIAGRKTVGDWLQLKTELIAVENKDAWDVAFHEFFKGRLDDRYLKPIKSIQDSGSFEGEGFAILAIICSLIEFLESTLVGKNYRFRRKGDPKLTDFEYGGSAEIFCNFLTKRIPFKNHFDSELANEFYEKVRCGLLHEARTKGKWTIIARHSNEILVEKLKDETRIYRDNFLDGLNLYIEKYKQQLLSSKELKDAFIRKYDNLCIE